VGAAQIKVLKVIMPHGIVSL